MPPPREPLRGAAEVVALLGVTGYMVGVAAWLRVSGELDGEHPRVASALLEQLRLATWRTGRRLCGRPPRGRLHGVAQCKGHCFVANVPWPLRGELADREGEGNQGLSRLVLLEDGVILGPPHATHDEIARLGSGRFSHWGARVYFSSSDGTDPRTNGRSYDLSLPDEPTA